MTSGNEMLLRVEMPSDHPHVMIVTLDNPPVNAINLALFGQIEETFSAIRPDGHVRCVVLTGAGDRAFIAGADRREHTEMTSASALVRSRHGRGFLTAIMNCAVPVIAAVNGPALGAGVAVAACCDVVIASDNATFGLPEVDVGVMGGANHLGRLVSPVRMRWMALSGARISAQEMLHGGGLERVTSRENLMPVALGMADEIAAKSPMATRLIKEMLNLGEAGAMAHRYHIEQLGTALLAGMEEAKEAAQAASEKRPPRF